jgi:hypothetical protein
MSSLEYLNEELRKALQVENYERAALLRDRIAEWKRLKGSRSGASGNADGDPETQYWNRFARPSAQETEKEREWDELLKKFGRAFFFNDPLMQAPRRFFDPRKLEPELQRMRDAGEALRQQLQEQYERMRRDTQDAIIKAVQEQVALYFNGLELDPYTMRGQVLRVIDHRDNTEEYHFRGRLLLVVDTGSMPWTLVKM